MNYFKFYKSIALVASFCCLSYIANSNAAFAENYIEGYDQTHRANQYNDANNDYIFNPYAILGLRDNASYHEILGLNNSANSDEIKKAYYKLALRWHPDKNPDRVAQAEEVFKLLSTAYEELCNPKSHSRTFHDRQSWEDLNRSWEEFQELRRERERKRTYNAANKAKREMMASYNNNRPILVSTEIAVSTIFGLLARYVFNLDSNKKSFKLQSCAGLACGTLLSQLVLNHLNPKRANSPGQTIACWIVGLSNGALLMPELLRNSKENK